MRGAAALILCLAASALAGQSGANENVSPEMVLLGRIRLRIAENLNGLPNYTCTQTIERSRRRSSSRKFEMLDTVRLEVALVDGKELFSWPGADRFEEHDLGEMVGGTIGNGDFALFAKAVFLSGGAQISIIGKESRDGRDVVRLRYTVPRLVSGYNMRIGEARGIVGYEGAAWVDAGSLDLVRLEVLANDIPPHLALMQAVDVIEYQRLPIGETDFLLPKASDMTMTALDGTETRNRAAFSRCRQYGSSSVLTFDEAPTGKEAPKAPVTITLPGDLDLPIRLTTAIQHPLIAKGDRFEAEVTRDIKRKGEVVIPKGARVEGRIVEYVNFPGSDQLRVIGLRLDRITFENKQGVLSARLEAPLYIGYSRSPGAIQGMRAEDLPGSVYGLKARDLIYVRGNLDLKPGFTMQWRTQDSSQQ
jgi:hypothetical protein